MSQKEILIDLVSANEGCVDFAPFGEGADPSWIDEAEIILNIKIPSEYRWFLENYGGGEINGQEIFSLYGPDYVDAGPGDVINYNLNNKFFDISKNMIICDNGSEIFYLNYEDKARIYKIDYVEDYNVFYSNDFISFIIQRIEHLCG